MIKRLFLIFAFICVAAGGAYGAVSVESTVEYTGREWVHWDEAKKDSFINGFIAGSNHVIWRGLKQARTADKSLMRYVVYNASGGRLLKGLDRFYSDEKNMGISLTDAIYIVNKSLRGAPAEEVGRLIEKQRRSKRQTIFVFGNGGAEMPVR